MRTKYIITSTFALIIFYAAAYYVGGRLLNTLEPYVYGTTTMLFWSVYISLSASYVIGRIGQVVASGYLSDWLIRVGAYWLGLFFYLLLIWGAFDALLLISKKLGILASDYMPSTQIGIFIFWAAGIIFCYGVWKARQPKLSKYTIEIGKPCRKAELHLAVVSDIHLGLFVGKKRLCSLINEITRLKPDLVLFPGDILDETVGIFLDNEMYKEFHKLQPSSGMFACLGSHEYIWGCPEKALGALHLAGITVLRDQASRTSDGVYVAGRDDFYRMRLTNSPRKRLEEVLEDCDRASPIILLDHYPSDFDKAAKCGVDLQLSGHTHSGQFFPINFITKLMFKLSHGILQQGAFHTIVSSGYGTWLLPLRVGTTPEVISITLKFKNWG